MKARRGVSLLTGALLLIGVQAGAAVADDPEGETVTVLTSGLDSPRGLVFGPDGRLYVATVGNGSDDGAIVRIDLRSGAATDGATGLPTFFAPAGASSGRTT